MAKKFIVKVAVENIVYQLDKLYDYTIAEDIIDNVFLGCRVLVPFGKGNKKRQGIILETGYSYEYEKLKPVFSLLDDKPILNDEMLKLAIFMKEKYFCTFFDAIKLMIPSGMNFKLYEKFRLCRDFKEKLSLKCDVLLKSLIMYLENAGSWVNKEKLIDEFGKEILPCLKILESNGLIEKKELKKRKILDAKIKMIRLSENFHVDDGELTLKQKKVFDILLQNKNGISLKELLYLSGVSLCVVENLVKKNIVESFEDNIYRNPYRNVNFDGEIKNINLTEEQNAAYNSILELYNSKKYKVALLYGVTGSGKTSVFMKLVERVVSEGKNVIVMVPEIALTPQMVAIFKQRFLDRVAVFHSGLSEPERLDEYRRVKKGLINVVVGTRSAVFAPFENIGLIVMDEEQESSYKSEATPRFHAREVAKFRCAYNKSLLLLSSATPSVESYFWAKNNKYYISALKNRHSGLKLPEVSIVDMNKEVEKGNFSAFSKMLEKNLLKNLNDGNQSILLLNRRGYNTLVSCRDCGSVIMCPNCSVALIYHAVNKKLMCHYCGFSMSDTRECPDCRGHNLKYIGRGTQKIEEELKEKFPKARILRIDSDSMTQKFSYEKKLKSFANKEYDIMLGTQMVAKGLNFPNVTLVGVLSADQSLYNGDFRSYERTFSLITQVVGRSGRANEKGYAIIQTFTPENPIIKLASDQDYNSFYNDEIKLRRVLLYPPFVKLCVIGFVGEKEIKTLNAAISFFEILTGVIRDEYSHFAVRILGPTPAQIFKVKNKFRYRMIIKFKDEKTFKKIIKESFFRFNEYEKFSGISILVDVDPDTIL